MKLKNIEKLLEYVSTHAFDRLLTDDGVSRSYQFFEMIQLATTELDAYNRVILPGIEADKEFIDMIHEKADNLLEMQREQDEKAG